MASIRSGKRREDGGQRGCAGMMYDRRAKRAAGPSGITREARRDRCGEKRRPLLLFICRRPRLECGTMFPHRRVRSALSATRVISRSAASVYDASRGSVARRHARASQMVLGLKGGGGVGGVAVGARTRPLGLGALAACLSDVSLVVLRRSS